MVYALDANIISYIIRGDQVVSENFRKAIGQGIDCIIPLIAYYEVKRGLMIL